MAYLYLCNIKLEISKIVLKLHEKMNKLMNTYNIYIL